MSDPFDETVEDALTTVRLVPRWTLPPDDWKGVVVALTTLHGAIKAGEPKLVRKSSEHLDSLYPPTRLSGIPHGHTSDRRDPPPPEVLELVNTLVHPDGGWGSAAGSSSDHSL